MSCLVTIKRHLVAVAALHKEEGCESPASVTAGALRKIWKGIVRENTRQQDSPSPLMVEDMKPVIEHLPRYSSSDVGSTGRLILTALLDRPLVLVGWTGALRRRELVALTTADIEFIMGEE